MLSKSFMALAGLGFAIPQVLAGFDLGPGNIAVYWGKNEAIN